MSNLDEVNMTPLQTEVIKPGGAVESVNGQTGVVVLTAEDIGAAGTEELAGEASARESADSALQESIVSEAATRAGEDGQLQGQITAEVNNRQQGDEDLQAQIDALQSGKVDVVEGKGLSSNDYTDAEKEKLAGLEGGGITIITYDKDSQPNIILHDLDEGIYMLNGFKANQIYNGFNKSTGEGTTTLPIDEAANVLQNGTILIVGGKIGTTATSSRGWYVINLNPSGGQIYANFTGNTKNNYFYVRPQNSLESSLTVYSLSANQGKALKDLYDALEARVAALEGNE